MCQACLASGVAHVADYMLHFTEAVTVDDIVTDDMMEQKELVPMEQGKDEGDDHTLVHNNQAGSPATLEDTQDNIRYGI